MTHVFLDTNVLLDHLLERKPFNAEAARLFERCESRQLLGFISPGCIFTMAYVIRKVTSASQTHQIIADLLSLFEVIPQRSSTFSFALTAPLKDIDDAFQFATAVSHSPVQCLITRNVADFRPIAKQIEVLTPVEFLKRFP